MYNVFRMNWYQMRRDRVLLLMVLFSAIFFFWLYSPIDAYSSITYTGKGAELASGLRSLGAPRMETRSFSQTVREAISANRTINLFVAYCFIFFNRDRNGHCFETACSITRDRSSVYVGNLCALVSVGVFFSLYSFCIAMLTFIVEGKVVYSDWFTGLLPFSVCYLIYLWMMASVFYALYILSRRVIVPLVIYLIYNLLYFLRSADVFPKWLRVFLVDKISMENLSGHIKLVDSWSRCGKMAMILVPIALACMLISLVVIHVRDLS